jgi:hypothetical protein
MENVWIVWSSLNGTIDGVYKNKRKAKKREEEVKFVGSPYPLCQKFEVIE